jgi:hypothetical protein
MSIVLNSDFIGKYELSLNNYNTDVIDAYILKYENKYLTQLLGVDLKALYDANPTSPIYLTITNALSFDYSGDICISNGIKEMLLGFIYYEYSIDVIAKPTTNGTVTTKNENSTTLMNNAWICSRFNEAVDTYNTIQKYILIHSSDYPTFNGQEIKYEYSI